MLAILTVAFATLAPSALAAEGQGDNNAGKQPTMADLASKVDSLGTRLGGIEATLGNLATATVGTSATSIASKVDALSSTVAANHTAIVGKFASQMAIVMTKPTTLISATSPTGMNYNAAYYLVGESAIPGFPAGTVAADGQFTNRGLPAGTYLFEVQHPYSDNVICQSSVSRRGGTTRANAASFHIQRFHSVCPWLRVAIGSLRIDDGFGIASSTSGLSFFPTHRFPAGFTFTDDKPLASYTGAFKITKLK